MITREELNTHRTTARIVGVVFLAGMVIGIGGHLLNQSILTAADPLSSVAANGMLLAIGALFALVTVAGDAAHGVLMFPILKQRSERLAFGYFGFRIVDAVFIAISVLFLLLQILVASEYLKAAGTDTSYLQALSTLSVQANLYAYHIAMTFLGIAGFMLCYTFYKARLVPRFVAVWGLVGYVTILVGSVLEVLGFPLVSMHTIPGGLWEVFIGVWLIVKGFNPSAFVPQASSATGDARTSSLAQPLVPYLDPAKA
jgi:hypothetical protein